MSNLRFAGIRALFFLFWAALIAVPIYGPFMGGLEGRFLPVTSPINVISMEPQGNGVVLTYTYRKLRSCELIGVSAANSNGDGLMFFPLEGRPLTKATGLQLSRSWFLGARDLVGVSITFLHRCSPFWVTITKVYG